MIYRLKRMLFFVGLLSLNQALAIDRQPWLGNIFEFEFQPSLAYQHYDHYSSGSHLKKLIANDDFLTFSLKNALPDIGVELEMTNAWTHHQKGAVDHISLAGRYVWQDDVAGDPFTLTTGLSFSQAFRHSLHDISSFHHGQEEVELFLSVGKEESQCSNWCSRWWGVFALGLAEKGSPWLRLNLNYEKHLTENQELKIFLNSLGGLGHHRLHARHFKGYGDIRHQSVEIGFSYHYLLEYVGKLNLEYAYRFYSLNFPAKDHRLQIEFLYTFGL